MTLPQLSATKIVMLNCHMDDSTKDRYDTILGRDLLSALFFNKRLCDHVIEAENGPLKVLTSPMVDMGTYEFKDLNTGTITPKE